MKTSLALRRIFKLLVLLPFLAIPFRQEADEAAKPFRAGAALVDITPATFPVIVNGMFTERTAEQAHDRLQARALVLDDGATRLAIVVADTCMMPRDLLDRAKILASKEAGIPAERMLISATHTHSAPAAMGCLGSRADLNYAEALPGLIAKAITRAAADLQPARIGWTVAAAPEHTFNRRWILRSDKIGTDPFGGRTVRANMHPGHENPDAIGPSGPVDPELSILSVQTTGGRPMALLANYSMHYYGSPILSADYFGAFAREMGESAGGIEGEPPFVVMMSQGTSGDLMWMDYSKPRREIGYSAYAKEIAALARDACGEIQYHDWVPLVMREAKLNLKYRVPDEARLAWAREIIAGMGERLPRTLPEVYALEQIYLHEKQETELKLQAIRIGALGITALPNEVYAITGLKLKGQSPLQPTFNIELANGAEGYIPPPEQHALGGYTTWAARTAGLEVEAEPKIVETVLQLLEEVAGAPRRKMPEHHGAYARAVLASRPLAYWRLNEISGPTAFDASGNGNHALYETPEAPPGIAYYLAGPEAAAFSGEGFVNRAPHLAGGRLTARLPELGDRYSISMWFWNGMPPDAATVTGYLFSRGGDGTGEKLAIGGAAHDGELRFDAQKNFSNFSAWGKTSVPTRTWTHVALVRDREKVSIFLNGREAPEISGLAEISYDRMEEDIFIGGLANGSEAGFEGKIDEVAIYNRALTIAELRAHYQASGMNSQ